MQSVAIVERATGVCQLFLSYALVVVLDVVAATKSFTMLVVMSWTRSRNAADDSNCVVREVKIKASGMGMHLTSVGV